MRQYFEAGDGSDAFGIWQSIAMDACRDLEADIARIAQQLVSPADFESTQHSLETWVSDHPLRGQLARDTTRPMAAADTDRDSKEAAPILLALPLVPAISPVGLEAGAQALTDIAIVGERFARVTENLPERTRWQTQLLLYDIEQRASVRKALDNLDALADTAVGMHQTIEALPQTLREELTVALDTNEPAQEGLRQTLADAQSTMSETQKTIREINAMLTSVEDAAAELIELGKVWNETGRSLSSASKQIAEDLTQLSGSNTPDGSTPFDIRAYATPAEQVTTAAVELRRLTSEVSEMLIADHLGERFQEVDTLASSIAERIFWRVVVIIIVFFMAFFAYRFAAGRFCPRSSSGKDAIQHG